MFDYCWLVVELGSAPGSVRTAKRPFRFHGNPGRQQNTEGEVSDPGSSFTQQKFTFNF